MNNQSLILSIDTNCDRKGFVQDYVELINKKSQGKIINDYKIRELKKDEFRHVKRYYGDSLRYEKIKRKHYIIGKDKKDNDIKKYMFVLEVKNGAKKM